MKKYRTEKRHRRFMRTEYRGFCRQTGSWKAYKNLSLRQFRGLEKLALKNNCTMPPLKILGDPADRNTIREERAMGTRMFKFSG